MTRFFKFNVLGKVLGKNTRPKPSQRMMPRKIFSILKLLFSSTSTFERDYIFSFSELRKQANSAILKRSTIFSIKQLQQINLYCTLGSYLE